MLWRERQRLNALARLLDGISYRAALERGFALVRGADGRVRRRAAAIAPGEKIILAFADGEVNADVNGGAGQPAAVKAGRLRRPPGDQGTLL